MHVKDIIFSNFNTKFWYLSLLNHYMSTTILSQLADAKIRIVLRNFDATFISAIRTRTGPWAFLRKFGTLALN